MLAVLLIVGAILTIAGFTWVTDPVGRFLFVTGVVMIATVIDLRPRSGA